jgi:pilus assembly protein Flp/PilA
LKRGTQFLRTTKQQAPSAKHKQPHTNEKGEFKMINKLINFFKDEEGVTMVEYALMVALIAVVAIGAVTLLGTNVSSRFNEVAGQVGPGGGGS